MSNLVLELRQGEMMIVNGAPIRFRTKSRIELTAKARFLFGKQIMPPDQADTPARRIYFAFQSAYIGSGEERASGLVAARELIAEFKRATTSGLACEILDRALCAAEADDCYLALKLTRRVIRHEDTVLDRTQAAAEIVSPPQLNPEGSTTAMSDMNQATRAYESAATHRTDREQEADVFHHAIGALKAARESGAIDRVRAIADNRRLWSTVTDLLSDPSNALPHGTAGEHRFRWARGAARDGSRCTRLRFPDLRQRERGGGTCWSRLTRPEHAGRRIRRPTLSAGGSLERQRQHDGELNFPLCSGARSPSSEPHADCGCSKGALDAGTANCRCRVTDNSHRLFDRCGPHRRSPAASRRSPAPCATITFSRAARRIARHA
jgi:flagellar protein FlbT